MPQSRVPYTSSTHRLACSFSHHLNLSSSCLHDCLGLSLYRALLKQSLAFSHTQSGGIRSLIRHRFQNNRFLQSPSQIANGLDAGNELLKLLGASAQGGTGAVIRLTSLLESTLNLSESNKAYRKAFRSAKGPSSPRLAARADHLRMCADKTLQCRRPDSRPILERPLDLSEIKGGKRRVPKFIATQGLAILLYTKPLPVSLGRVLRQKFDWLHKKWDQRDKLMAEVLPLAQGEDHWDSIIALQSEQEGLATEKIVPEDRDSALHCDSITWASFPRFADARLGAAIQRFEQRNLERGRQVVEILKQERVLAAKEKAALECKKYEERELRRASDAQTTSPAGQKPKQDGPIAQRSTG
jgi:Complex 1 protein (LYR family)